MADVLAELGHVAFEVQLILLEPANVEFLTTGAALELACNVLFIITDDSGKGPC